ncbi:MAG: hypothetical protein JRH20_22840 [Deltaproteobacteria bacterium]|nr:hypothetical protein [Deltaproteobacteria bacterium]
MHTNIHVHLFSADHTPPPQLYYLLRGALHGPARDVLGLLGQHPATVAQLMALDRSLNAFHFPWPQAFELAIKVAKGMEAGDLLLDLGGLITMLTTVSRATRAEVQDALGVDAQEQDLDMLEHLLKRTLELKAANHGLPFRDALCELVKKLYDAHEHHVQELNDQGEEGRISYSELWQAFSASPGADTFKRVIVLSINFDEAFLDEDLPQLDSSPTLDIWAQIAETKTLVDQQSVPGQREIVPFLGIDPRGYSSADLLDLAQGQVGKDKLFKGIKLYPPMGVRVFNDKLMPLFRYCQDHGIPVLSHCSVGGAGLRGGYTNYADWASPSDWQDVLKMLATRNDRQGVFRLCLAHFDRLEQANLGGQGGSTWCPEIVDLMSSYSQVDGVKVYTDVAFDTVNGTKKRKTYAKNVRYMQQHGLTGRVLFGSDWWNYLYECKDEQAFIDQLNIDDDDDCWWLGADFDAASNDFLRDVCAPLP